MNRPRLRPRNESMSLINKAEGKCIQKSVIQDRYKSYLQTLEEVGRHQLPARTLQFLPHVFRRRG